MKLIFLAILTLLLVDPYFGQEKELKNFSDAKLELAITGVKKTTESLEIEFTLKNNSPHNILAVMPQIDESFKTNYFLGLDEENQVLQIRRHLFSYPASLLDGSMPCYDLIIIEKDTNYIGKFSLTYPIAISSYFLSMKVNISKYSKFNAQIGVLPFNSSINQIPDNRPFGHCVMPEDEIEDGIYKGKTLLEVQRILTANSK